MTNILREILEEQIQNTTRRDNLSQNEKLIQQKWAEAKAFEFDAAEDLKKPKYFATFPYPYMNGRLHLGHMYTVSKADFVVYYQRMKGKQAIFPFSFHVTGMPIKSCADKLKRELETFGPTGPPPPTAEELAIEKDRVKKELLDSLSGESAQKSKAPAQPKEKKKPAGVPGEFHSKKSKAVAKSGEPDKTQWDIMRSIGLTDDLIVKFTDANFWLEYFPPLCQQDLKAIGAGIDWRRSFYTTVANPFYDRFVRWQFNQLKEKKKVDFGKRFSIYSPLDGQPCMDHDRRKGETVLPQEYTLIKMQLTGTFPEKLQSLEGKFDVFLAAATLRPETMYGQTNCWVLPTGEYGAYQISEREVYIISERAALNLAYQAQSFKPEEVTCLLTISGADLLGAAVKAPLGHYPVVYALPMLSIKMDKGTGVVTSVPSDSPDDYATLRDLKNKPALREKFSIKDEWILPFEPVPILETSMGSLSAEAACEMFKIASQNDKEKLNEAKEHVYKLGFYEAVMKVGPHAGKKVLDVKDSIRAELIEAGLATKYAEPASEVISRSGDTCVVALTDQWFLTYGEAEWRAKTERALARLDTFNDDTKHQFAHTLGWLDQWACSRTYGLGSRLPWDPKYLIESLSDSTIYMAYYSIAHLLQGGTYDGSAIGPLGIQADQLTDAVFDYVFLKNKPYPVDCGIPEEDLQKLQREFQYWYPLDLRVSGKDLIPNHLTFMLYNHTAIWEDDESKWPLGVRGNGHLLLNSKKMAKQTGNFLTIADSVELFGADATRIALAHAGDSFDDANYASGNANKAVLDLYNGLAWAEEILVSESLKDRPIESVEDRTFDSIINDLILKADQAYDRMLFQKALIFSFYELRIARDNYRMRVGADNMNRALIQRYIEVQALLMCPIAPHWAERVWTLLGKSGFAVHASFPVAGPVDEVLVAQDASLWKLIDDFRKKIINTKSRKAVASGKIYVATRYPEWHARTVEIAAESFDLNGGKLDAKKITDLLKTDAITKKFMKVAVPLVKQISDRVADEGKAALDLKMAYDEKEFLTYNQSFLQRTLEIPLEVVEEDGSQRVAAVPKIPTIYFD